MSTIVKALPARREQRIRDRNAKAALLAAKAALAERNAILAELRGFPLKKLRAIRDGARQAFGKQKNTP